MEDLKRLAAERAVVEYVESGMVVGLGTGSTASWVVREIGRRMSRRELRGVRGVPTSRATEALARQVGIPLTGMGERSPDVVLDGADEIGPGLALVKGHGGALLREKIVAAAAGGLVVVADGSKLVGELGRRGVPVEIEPFGWETTLRALSTLGCEATLRVRDGKLTITDGGHFIADCRFGSIPDPAALDIRIKQIPGAIETGLFIGLTRAAVVADTQGVAILQPPPASTQQREQKLIG